MQSTPQPAQRFEASLRSLRIIHLILLASMLFYVFVAARVIQPQVHTLDRTVKISLAVEATAFIGIAFLIRAKMVRPSLEALQSTPDDLKLLARWRKGSITSFVFAEAVVLLGFAVYFLCGTLAQSISYYIAGTVLMLLWWPRRA